MEVGYKDSVCGSCAVHPSKPVTSYCSQHRLSICITCLLTDHRTCIEHVKAIDTDISSCHSTSCELERIYDRLTNNVSDVKNRKTAWIDNLEKVETELLMGLRQMRHRIVNKMDKLCKEAMDMTKSVLKEHKTMYEADIEILYDYQCRLKEIKQKLYELKTPDGMLSVERQLEEIKNEFQRRNMKAGDVKVHFHVSEMVSRLETHMDTFGELCVEDVTEKVRSLYLSPSEIQRFSTDILGEKWNHKTTPTNGKYTLFITADEKDEDETGDVYRLISPSPDVSPICSTRQDNPPPLPTMENRMLSPRIVMVQPALYDCYQQESFNISNGRINETNETSDFSEETELTSNKSLPGRCEEQNKKEPPVGNLEIPGLPFRDAPYRGRRKRENERIEAIFFEPKSSRDDKTLQHDMTRVADENEQAMPNLPKKTTDVYRRRSSSSGQTNIESTDGPALEAGERGSDTRHETFPQDLCKTLPRTRKQPTMKHKHNSGRCFRATSDTKERPISNPRNCSDGCCSTSSGRDSGIALSQELPSSKNISSESALLKIPALPSKNRRKLSDPSPSIRRRESRCKTRSRSGGEPRHYSNRKSCSETDLSSRASGDVTYIRAKEMNPDREAIYNAGPDTLHKTAKTKRLVKSAGYPPMAGDIDIILDITSGNKQNRSKVRNATFITAMTALDGGKILVCDFRNNSVELYDSYGLLKDVFELQKPFGCCHTGENSFAVTSRDPPKISTFVTESSRMKQIGERVIDTVTDVFGISFSHGFFCISCLTEVKLFRDKSAEQEIQIRPLERHGKPRASWFNRGRPKPFFTDVQYSLMEKLEDRFYIFTSDIKRKRVTSVGLNGMVVWTQSNLETRTLAYYKQQVIVATERQVVLLDATSGQYIRDIRTGIPRHPWSLAVDTDLFPCLLVSGCGKTCSRQVTRVRLEQASVNVLTDELYV